MRRRVSLALAVSAMVLGCPTTPPRFGGGAAEGVAEAGSQGDGGDDGDGNDGTPTEDDGVDDGSGDGDGGSGEDGGASTDGMPDDGGSDGPMCPGGVALGEACDPFANDCPECEKCVATASPGALMWDESACAPIQPDAAGIGEPCTYVDASYESALDTCDADGVCWWLASDTQSGVCLPRCVGNLSSPSCTDPDMLCWHNTETHAFCVQDCNPVHDDCDPGEGCYPMNAELFVCLADTSGVGGETGDPCGAVSDCSPGFFCSAPSNVPGCVAQACCTGFCDPTSPIDTCAPFGQSCFPYWVVPPMGYEDVGFCSAT